MDDIWNLIERYFYSADSMRVYDNIINDIERVVIVKALERSCGNQVAAAKILGLHRNTLSNKIKKFNIDAGSYKR